MYFPTKEAQLGGVFDYLYEKHSQNYKDFVKTDQSSICDGWSDASVLVVSHQGTAKTDNFASNGLDFPIKWVIEAADDKQMRWIEISRVDNSNFNDYYQYKTFPFAAKGRTFSHFRFTMKDLNYANVYYFVLHRIEFFGYLYSNSEDNLACTKGKRSIICVRTFFYIAFVS